jgi:hypothetical protein
VAGAFSENEVEIKETDAMRVVQMIEQQAERDVSAHPFDADMWRCRAQDMLDGIATLMQFANVGGPACAARVICAALESQDRIRALRPVANVRPRTCASGAAAGILR